MSKRKTAARGPRLHPRLRPDAEKRLALSPGASAEMRERPLEDLIHELQVHQVELEMQNEELRKAQIALEESRDKYVGLYEFAPVGYFTLTRAAVILEVNLSGAALLGAILPGVLTTGWHLPRLWRGALVFVAPVTIVGAPIIVWREVDGALPIAFGIDIHWLGGAAPFIVSWVLHVAIMAVVGILWFDWLLGEPNLDLERTIITPLIVGVVVMSAVSAYQTFVDIHFFNETVYQNLGRATGTMWDANLAGMLAALWLGGTILWADRLRGWLCVVRRHPDRSRHGRPDRAAARRHADRGVRRDGAFAVSAGRLRAPPHAAVGRCGVLIASVVVLGLATRNSANPAGRLSVA